MKNFIINKFLNKNFKLFNFMNKKRKKINEYITEKII